MNIISKLIITVALLALLPVNGDEMKMTKETSAAPLSVGKSKAESSRPKTSSKATPLKSRPEKSSSRKVVADKPAATKTAAPAKAIAELTPSQADKVLALLNGGTREELAAINGIAGTRADSIVSARPFKSLNDLILVPGVGDVTVDRIIEHGRKPTEPSAKSVKS